MRRRNISIRGRARTECGASLVEAALATPVLLLLILLVFDTAFFMRSDLSARYAATDGSRIGAIAGSGTDADYRIIEAVKRASVAGAAGNIITVIVFKADTATSDVPVQCLSGPQKRLCNVYSRSDLNRSSSEFTAASGFSNHWSSADRRVSRTAGVDYLGVYVSMRTGAFTGLFATTTGASSVSAIEASQY